MTTGFVTLEAAHLAYLVHAVRRQDELYRRNGAMPPAGIRNLLESLSHSVSEGQGGSRDAAEARTVEVERVSPLLVSYSDAAAMLSISVSTLKRRIAAGDLHPVSIGGTTRIRVADLETYVSTLSTQDPKDH